MNDRSILLAAGGTGGHLFPAEALAHELAARGWRVDLATDGRAARFADRFPGKVHAVDSATIGGRNPVALARAGLKLWAGFRQASALIGKLRPKAVVGFGGYPTLPPLFAATRRGLPTLIHEQNAVMGRANKALAPRVSAIAGGFLGADGPFGAKTVVTGNPVRPAVIEAAQAPYQAADSAGAFRLVVFGGSQGAQFFAQAVPAALASLDDGPRGRIRLTLQARKEDEQDARTALAAAGIEAEVSPFFADMPARIAAAHLVISRSGASTVSEIAAIGRPAILVPYPHALDHDQAANAAALAATGGAQVRAQSELSPRVLAAAIGEAIADPEGLARRAAGARSAGRPDAARLLADLAEAIAAGITAEDFRKGARP